MNAALPAAGQLLEGKNKIVGLVGEGAWGEVLEGVNVRIQRKVAIKILKAEYASNEQMVTRFEREALASTHIESPHVVQVFDAGMLADGRPYLVMEFLNGEDLSTHIAAAPERRLPIVTAVDLCMQVARGLAAAHASGVFHRDMKPSNVFIAKTKSGREVAKIVDFGISKLLDTSKEPTSNTQTGTILGSPVYMSPEQARGSKTADHRSDIYSLGVVLFECLTGVTPHSADSFNELLFKIVLEATPSARALRPEIDEDLDAILRRTLTKTPEIRVQTAVELEGLLIDWLTKHGGRVESLSDSGQRVPSSLTASPVLDDMRDGESSGKLRAAKPASDPELLTTAVLKGTPVSDPAISIRDSDPHSDPHAQTMPAPTLASGSPKSLEASLTPSSTTARVKAAPSRRGYMIAGAAALAVAIGVIAVGATRGGPKVTGSGEPTATPSAATTPSAAMSNAATPSATMTNTAMPVASADPLPSASATAASASASPGARPGTGRPLVGVSVSGPRPKPTSTAAVSTPTAEPAPTGAGPASVGGRTIRTDL
jgi:serine/threonine-protein kinase